MLAVPEGNGFLTRRPAPSLSEDPERFSTTYGCAFGTDPVAPYNPSHGAIGRSGARPERGIATSGMIGEVFKSGADPQHNTACQRVWLPSSSLVLDPAKRAPVPVDDVKPTTANCMQYM